MPGAGSWSARAGYVTARGAVAAAASVRGPRPRRTHREADDLADDTVARADDSLRGQCDSATDQKLRWIRASSFTASTRSRSRALMFAFSNFRLSDLVSVT